MQNIFMVITVHILQPFNSHRFTTDKKTSRVFTVKVRISSQVDTNKVFSGPWNHGAYDSLFHLKELLGERNPENSTQKKIKMK